MLPIQCSRIGQESVTGWNYFAAFSILYSEKVDHTCSGHLQQSAFIALTRARLQVKSKNHFGVVTQSTNQ